MTKEELESTITSNVLQKFRDAKVMYPANKQGKKCIVKTVKHIIKQQEIQYAVKIVYMIDISVHHGLKLQIKIVQD